MGFWVWRWRSETNASGALVVQAHAEVVERGDEVLVVRSRQIIEETSPTNSERLSRSRAPRQASNSPGDADPLMRASSLDRGQQASAMVRTESLVKTRVLKWEARVGSRLR